MDEPKTPPGFPGDRSQAAAEKLRALRERANEALDDHRRRLADLETQLNSRVRQLAEEFGGEPAPLPASGGHEAELAELRRQLEEGHVKHDKFIEQLAVARRQLDAIQSQPCSSCQQAAEAQAAAEGVAQQLRQELETAHARWQEERTRHDKFVEQLAQARHALSELQSVSGDRAAELAAELESTRAEKTKLADELQWANAASAKLESELQSARAAKVEAEGQLAASSRDLTILHAEVDELTVRSAAMEQELAAAKSESAGVHAEVDDRRRTAEAEIQELRQDVAAAGDELRAAHAVEATLAKQVESLEAALGAVQNERDELAGQRDKFEGENRKLAKAAAESRATVDADQVLMAAELASTHRKVVELMEQLAGLDEEKASVEEALAESATAQQELRTALEAATQDLESIQEQAAAAVALRVELETAQAEVEQLRGTAASQQDFDQLRQKFELALADVQKLKRENGALREELSRRPEANDQETPELIAARSERDALALRVNELEAAAAAAIDAAAQQQHEDLQRRFEMAVDDVRQLKQENAQLRDKLAALPKSGPPVAPAAGGALDWAAQRARLMAMLEEEEHDGTVSAERKKERATIESTIAATDRAIADKDREIGELQTSIGSHALQQDEQGRAMQELLDADETIAVERRRLVELQTQWEDKVRAAELEISVERAKLARDQAALKERTLELQLGTPQAGQEVGGELKPRRRWLAALGLGDEEELKKKK